MSKKISDYKSKYSLTQRIISAMTAVGFIMQPIAGFAQSINKVDNNGSIEVSGNVTKIWADKVVANAAINEFKDFQLDANKIANMYFNTKNSSGSDAANLVNFVNSRIDINGTVNAVRNSKIGGNLFFLSKEGMVVGKSGVINTGALYVMTPAAGIDNITGTNSKEFAYTYEGLKSQFAGGMENKIPDTLDRMMNLNIPLNASGTISVLGKINATNDVKLAAAKIAVGKNVSGEAVFDTAADSIVSEAAIKTGIEDFSNFVNIDGLSAGLGNDLTATADGNGDIVLAAKAEYVNTMDAAFNNLGTDIGLGIVENTQRTIEATVENYGTIDAKGDAVLTAEVTNGNKDLAEELLVETTPAGVNNPDYVPVPADDAGSFVQTIAQVDVRGDITAGKDIKVAANADNTYVDYNSGVGDTISKILGTPLGAPINADVVILSNTANVNISQDADLTAGEKIDITANAVLDGTAGAAANGRKLIKKVPDAIPGASVSYAKMENSAAVTVNGTLTAKGENDAGGTPAVKVQANAGEKFSNTASMNYKSGIAAGTAAVGAAVAVSESKNNAAVKINGTITAANGDAVVEADAANILVANAVTSSPDTTVGSTAINVFNHDGSAQINVDGAITAQNITVDATNYIDENTITADNDLGMSKLEAEFMNAANLKGIADAVKENSLVKGILSKISSGDDGPSLSAQLADKLSVGAAIAVADENNAANVTFAKTAKLTATNDINIDANVDIYDSHITASGKTTSYKNSDLSGTTATTTVGAGVVYAGMDNDSSVVFEEGSSAADGAEVTATNGNVNITSSTRMEYHRPERIKRELDRSIENLQYAIAAINDLENIEEENYQEIITQLTSLKESLENYAANYTDEFVDSVSNPDAITGESTMNDIFNMAARAAVIYNDVMDLQQDFNSITTDATSPFGALVTNALGVVKNAVAFADPNNYANVAAAASARGGDGTKLSVSGSVALTSSSANSSVDIGKFTKISAGKDLSVKSSNKIEDVNITGKTMFWQSDADAKGGTGVGGSFNYQNFDTDSKVVVDEGAVLSAEKNEGNIALSSDSNIFHVGAMLSAGMSDGNGISGMVTLTDSDSYNNVVVDTDAVLRAAKAIDISAYNDTNVNNAILALSASGSNAAVGMGVAINNIDVQNTAQIVDNDGAEGEEDKLEGEISAAALNVAAETTGLINTISIAGGVTKSGDDGEEGFLDKLKAPFKKMEDVKTNALNKVNAVSNKLQDVIRSMDSGSSAQGGGNAVNTAGAEAGLPGFTFAGAGSVSLNMVEDTTKAVIDGANIKLNNDGKLTVGARDSAFIGAWSGGAAVSYRKGQNSSTSVAVSGAVGVNDIANEVTALIKDSTVTGAKDVDVAAVSGGTAVAAGVEATLTKDASQGKNYSGGASVSVNLIDKDINSNMENVSLTGAADGADVDVTAYESDIQVTGGINANIALGGGSMAGGAVTVADIKNNINAGISRGSYENINAVDVQGLSAVTQVTAAVSAGIAAGGQGGSNAFSGAVVYNGLTNNVQAGIADASIKDASGNNASSVTVQASDISVSSAEAKPYQDLLGDYDEHKKFAEERGIDTDGKAYYEDADTADEEIEYDNGGSTIVGAAVVVAGTNGNAAGAAVNVADINNSFAASIENADIQADTVKATAEADTLLVGVSGGVAVGAKQFGGMGSVTWQDIDNDVTAQVINSELTSNDVDIAALNKTQAVNVAGSVSVGKTAGVGAALAYNGLDNNVGAYLKGSSITASDVSLKAANEGKVYGIGAGVAASAGTAAVNGSVAINKGGTNTEAIIDEYLDENGTEKRTEINNVTDIDVSAKDDTYRLAVVGSVTGSSKVAAGGAIAYNDIGGSSADTEKSSQRTVAAINNTDINKVDSSSAAIDVKADDQSELKTIAVGVGGSGNVAVQGAAATALINKQVEASMMDVNAENASNVAVTADNNSEVTTSADVAAVSGNASVGAGVAVNRILQQTNAVVNGGTMDATGNLLVKASGTPRIENIGVGGSGAGSGAAVTGSVAVNMIDNDVNVHIGSGAQITADGSIGIVATSDEQIANYAGTASVAGTGAAVGVSVSVNQIKGTSSATVGGQDEAETTLTALGNSSLTTATKIDKDSEINNTLINEETVAINSKIDRSDETRKGLIVDASSTRDLKSFLLNAAVAGEGAGVTGTVNVNMIDGATNAAVTNTSVNNETGVTANDVFVNAGDYTNSSGFVGTVGGTGIGAGVGLGSDTNTISREVSAVVEDSSVNAKAFEVDADSAQGVSSFTVGAGVAGIGGGVAGVVTVTELNNATKAALLNSTVNADSVAVQATHTGIVNAGNVSVGAGIVGAGAGVSVGALKDNSKTTAEISDDITDTTNKDTITSSDDVIVAAANTTTVNPMLSATGVGAGGIAGATSINNINSKVVTNITNIDITSNKGSISGTADNVVNVDAYMGSQAAGLGGAGVGVTVNTIDSTVQTNVNYSNLKAGKDINLTAKEERNIEQLATNATAGAAAAIGANIAVTNIGQEITDEDVKAKIAEANAAYGDDADSLLSDMGALETAGIASSEALPSVAAGYGGNKDSQITVNIIGGSLDADNNVTTAANETDHIEMTLGGASASLGLAGAAGVGLLNIHRNVGVAVSGADITADNIQVGTNIDGEANLDVYQGSAGLINGNAAVGKVNTSGSSAVSLAGTTVTGQDIDISAQDNSDTDIDSVAVAAGGLAVGALVAEAENSSDVNVVLQNANVTANSEAGKEETGKINVAAEKNNSITVNATNVVASTIGGAGMQATVSDNGSNIVQLNGSTMSADKNIDVAANTASQLTANVNNDGVGVLASGAVSIAEVNIGNKDEAMRTAVKIGSGNTFRAQEISFKAISDIQQNVLLKAVTVSGLIAGDGNTATTSAYSDTVVASGNNNIYTGTETADNSNEYDDAEINFAADNKVTQSVNASGISAAGAFATGTNIGTTNSVLNTSIDINSLDSKVKNLNAAANSAVKVTDKVNGDGGALIGMSPVAAKTVNNIKSNTNVKVSGKWNIAEDMNISALHDNAVKLSTDAVKASVVGYSGVRSENSIANNTTVTFDNANVITGGNQNISARNDVDYDAVITGSGYGAIEGADVYAEDDIDMAAKVSFISSALQAGGAVTVDALTGDAGYQSIGKPSADINKEVTIKSAGVIAGTYAESNDNIDYENIIDIGEGTTIATVGTDMDNANITFTAADRTNFTDITTADTQGGAIGAAGTTMNNNINRTNTVNISGTVDSNYDADFDAGNTSVLNLTLKSNAYNKTAAPIETEPSINGKMTQNSAINFNTGSSVKSLRNINAAAGVGDTTIAKESKTWRWVDGGETGTGSIASTSDGTLSGDDAVINTAVKVDGSLEAGKNHELDITIDYNENGKTNLENKINEYGEDLKLDQLAAALETAQKEYDENTDVELMRQKAAELKNLKEQQQNNSKVKAQLQTELNNLNSKKVEAESELATVKKDLNTYLFNSCNEYNKTLAEGAAKIEVKDFIAALENNDTDKPWVATYIEGYNVKQEAVNTASETVENYSSKITSKTTEISKYEDFSSTISDLTESIAELREKTQGLLDKVTKAQSLYNEALREGINEETVNNAIFGGQVGNKDGDYVKVTVPDWYKERYGSAVESIGMADYAASLLNRMNELVAMSQEYSGTDVGNTYKAELTRIQSELQALGLLIKDSEGNIGIAEGASTVPTIELKDLMVSGGDVNISSGSMGGSGQITAHGNPSITVTNNTDFFLKVNDITVDSAGGNVRHNSAGVVTNSGKYNGIAVNADTGASGSGNNAQITISNTTSTKASESNLYTPDIGIYGDIINPFGNISINNAQNSIYVVGEVKDNNGNITQKAGSIKGRTINLTAGGAVTQGYTDEIYDVAGNPKDALDADYISAIQNALTAALGNKQNTNGKYYAAFDSVEALASFLQGLTVNGNKLTADEAKAAARVLTGENENNAPGIAAGGAIYINAASINVNGTIQSGFESYKLNINQTKAQSLMNSAASGAAQPDSNFMTDDYLVTDGSSGAVYDETTKQFVYNIRAWYNPTTNQIFTEDIEQAGGGRIYLTGAIANTNASGGKLVVLDGGSNYDINGSVAGKDNGFTFKLGSINAATVAGRIEINDTNTNTTTVYTKDNVTVNANGDRTATYNPEQGQYYTWSNGTASRVTTSYKHVSDSSWFGLSSSNWEDVVNSFDQVTKDSMQIGEPTESNNELLDTKGNIITDGSVGDYKHLGSDGSGTAAITGSTDKNSNTLYQIMFERKGEPKQGVNDQNQLLYWGKDGDGNDVLTTTDTGNPYYLTDDKGNYIYETEVSERVTTTKKKGLFGLWGKTVTTEWKETSGMLTAYNFGLKADNPIGIEFVGNADGSTGTITSNSDILLGGDIHMGKVDITSTTGNIRHEGDATLVSDNATLNAQTGIDVIQKNMSDALRLNAVSANGNINIIALAANNNNSVYIDNVSTAGNVNITAEGDMLNGTNANNAAHITGNEITLLSYGGSIGSSDQGGSLLIDGGTAGINAQAAEGIYLSETDGNMYLGKVAAENGDVVLEVQTADAGFVDAFTDNSVISESDEARIENWEKLGLLGGDEKNKNSRENQQKNLANTAESGSFFLTDDITLAEAKEKGTELLAKGQKFVQLMQGNSAEVEAARQDLNTKQGALNEAIANLGDDAASKQAYKTALENYNAAYDVYAEKGAAYEQAKANFIAESGFADNAQAVAWLTNYEVVGNAAAENYGWTEQQLLYAIRDSVINPAAGSISDVKTANVTGNNITFISDTGNIGVVDTQKTVIKTDSLTAMFTGDSITDAEKEQLDKLAMARAGDVTWGDEEITIERTTPVSVQLNGNGKVTVQKTGNTVADHVYLLAKDSVLNADKFAANDLRLSGQQGINVGNIAGDKIYLEGGSGDIGHSVNDVLQAVQVTLNNNGYVNANAAGNVKLQQAAGNNVDFTVNSIAGENVDIKANGSIVSKADDIGYINADGIINLNSENGGIGSADAGLRIKNSGAVVNADVENAVNIEAKQDGTLILGTINQNTGGVKIDSEGALLIGREDDTATIEDEKIVGYIDAKDDVDLHAASDIIISGKLHVKATADDSASENGTLRLHSDEGDIIQTTTEESENIVAQTVELAAIVGDVQLANKYNIIKNVDLQAVGGSLALTVSKPDGFNIDMGGFTNKLGGDIEFTNSDGSVNITTEDIVDPTQKDPAYINGNLIITAQKGEEAQTADINNDGILHAVETITFDADDKVINNEELTATQHINFTAGNDVENNVELQAGQDISFAAGNDVENNAELQAGQDINFTAGNDVNNNKVLNAGEDINFVADNNIINKDIVNAGENINFTAGQDIINESTANANETITFTAVDGKITSNTVDGKDVIIQAIQQELQNIIAKDSVTFSGDKIHAQYVQQNQEAEGDLIINTSANKGAKQAIDSFIIDLLEANNRSVFTELWAKTAYITSSNDEMFIEKLSIEDVGHFNNSGTKSVVYGDVPIRDAHDAFLWYSPDEQRNPWMYLNFTDYDTIDTNGVLLRLKEYWYAYDQRFTAENHLRYLHNYYLHEDYDQIYGHNLSLHERYNLIDYQDFREKNAEDDEIIVNA